MKKIKIFFSKLGRKNKYLGIYGKKSSYPVIYFRKSKFATQEEFDYLIENIENNFERE